jgi:hypothetical protein
VHVARTASLESFNDREYVCAAMLRPLMLNKGGCGIRRENTSREKAGREFRGRELCARAP